MTKKDIVYTAEDMSRIDRGSVPQHIAIIMDGNRRWARSHKLDIARGHWEGGEALRRTIKASSELGVKVLTVYAFSTENWERPRAEVSALMTLIENFLIDERAAMVREGVRFDTIGDLSRFPEHINKIIEVTKEATIKGTAITLVLALNYGGRDEICRAVNKAVEGNKSDDATAITEEIISQHLDTARWGDPDMMIRTGGERRLSNFMLWQLSYAELYITEALWPEFGSDKLLEAIYNYQKREQRFGR